MKKKNKKKSLWNKNTKIWCMPSYMAYFCALYVPKYSLAYIYVYYK